MTSRIFTHQYNPETRLFYYTAMGAGTPYPIAYQYNDGIIDIFLNLPTKTKQSIEASLKETTSGAEVIDHTNHDAIRETFGKLVDLSTKRIVWAATEFSGCGFKLIKFSNTAWKITPDKIAATYNVRSSKIPNKLIQIVHGFRDSRFFKMRNGMTYLPPSIGNIIADTIAIKKPTVEEVQLKKDIDAFVQSENTKNTYELTLNGTIVKVTKSVNGILSDIIIVGHYKKATSELDLYDSFESFRHELCTAVTLADISSKKSRSIDMDFGEKLFVAFYAPPTEYKPTKTHDHVTSDDINKMVENVVDIAGNVSKRLGKPVGENITIDEPIEATIKIEGELVRAVDEVANMTTEEFVEKWPKKTETTTKPSEPVSDISMKNEKDTNDDLARRLGKITIKPVPTKTSAISFSNRILLL